MQILSSWAVNPRSGVGSESMLGAGKGRWEVARKRAKMTRWFGTGLCLGGDRLWHLRKWKLQLKLFSWGTIRSVSTFSLAQGLPANKTWPHASVFSLGRAWIPSCLFPQDLQKPGISGCIWTVKPPSFCIPGLHRFTLALWQGETQSTVSAPVPPAPGSGFQKREMSRWGMWNLHQVLWHLPP